MKRLLVTGASGFIGKRLTAELNGRYEIVTITLRDSNPSQINFQGVDVVVHLAGIAHRMEKTDSQLYYDVNHEKTMELAEHAKKCGVKQFVFMSTIKVYGVDFCLSAINEKTPCKPGEPYGRSKYLAEQGLIKLMSDNFIVSIIRTPVVYGAEVKGNILRLIQMANNRSFMPFGNISNKRSMIYIKNLIKYIDQIVIKQSPGIFLPSDDKPFSTTELVQKIIDCSERKVVLISIPRILRISLKILLSSIYNRLFGSLYVDNEETNKALDISNLTTREEGVKEMVVWYKSLSS